jgi:hypothetical protein
LTAVPRTLALAIAAAAITTGCGSSSKPAASASSRFQQAIKYSGCMRAHGVPGFPDPSKGTNGRGALIIHGGPGAQFDPSSPSFQAAQKACAKLLPAGGAGGGAGIPANAKQQALRFSACMRRHGVPGFPDPVFEGNGARLQLSAGVNPASPAFKTAQRACGSPLPNGVLSGSSSVGGPG